MIKCLRALLVAVLLLVFGVMATTAARAKSNTFDELPHLAGGFSYWRTKDFRLHPENGALPQRLAALPLLLLNLKFPSLQQPAWEQSDVWSMGYQFLYGAGNDPERMLFWGRFVITLLAIWLGYLIYVWARELFGPGSGLVALTLYVFCPSFLAHGSLVTTDLAVTLFFLLSIRSVWKLVHDVSPVRILIAAASISALLLSKVSSLLIIPVSLLLLVIRLLRSQERKDAAKLSGAFIAVAAITVLLIWFNYGFRHSAFRAPSNSSHLSRTWSDVSQNAGSAGRLLSWANQKHLLPEAYLFGITYILSDQTGRRAFLNGNYSVNGWWYFFPYAFLVKTPIPLLILLCFGIVAIRVHQRNAFYELWPLVALVVVYWLFALSSSVNIGHRYLLPIYPAIFIIAGASFLWFKKKNRIGIALLAAILGWGVTESLWIRPHYLAYFNELSGGPGKGYRHLVDSSLDWGQDLPELKKWLVDNGGGKAERIFFSYFGTGSPDYYKIRAVRLPSYADQRRPQDKEAKWTGGIYCISATMLASIYTPVLGRWSAPYESAYQELRNKPVLTADEQDFFTKLEFARLCAFLRRRQPDAQPGYSILVYRLSDADVRAALFDAPPELEDRLRIRGLAE